MASWTTKIRKRSNCTKTKSKKPIQHVCVCARACACARARVCVCECVCVRVCVPQDCHLRVREVVVLFCIFVVIKRVAATKEIFKDFVLSNVIHSSYHISHCQRFFERAPLTIAWVTHIFQFSGYYRFIEFQNLYVNEAKKLLVSEDENSISICYCICIRNFVCHTHDETLRSKNSNNRAVRT